MVQKQVTPRGGWGRRPKGDAPRSEASALGAAGCRQLDPSHPALITCEDAEVEPCPVNDPIKPNLHAFFMFTVEAKIRTTLEHVPAALILSFSHEFGGFSEHIGRGLVGCEGPVFSGLTGFSIPCTMRPSSSWSFLPRGSPRDSSTPLA